MVSLEEAAEQLGISVNAVRQRIKRNTVAAVKTDQGWLVDMVATNQRPTTNKPTSQPTNQGDKATDHQPTIDLASLAKAIESQTKQISDLSAAVGMWQSRAVHLDGEVKQVREQLQEANEKLQRLAATVTTSVESTDEAAGSPQSDETDDQVQSIPARENEHTPEHLGTPGAMVAGSDMNMQRGYLIGLLTTIVLVVDASTAQLRNATRAEDVVAHAVFAGIPAVAAIVAYQWQSIRSAWVFLVPAFICALAGVRGFEQFWAYALAFTVAGIKGVVALLK